MKPVTHAKMMPFIALDKQPNIATAVAPRKSVSSVRAQIEQYELVPKTCPNGMIVTQTEIADLLIIEPKLFGDQRGFFLETFQVERYQSCGIRGPFIQDNLSRSGRGVLRGLHLQNPNMQGKLVSVMRGRVPTWRSMSGSAVPHSDVTSPWNYLKTIAVSSGCRADSPTASWCSPKAPISSTNATHPTVRPTNSSFAGTTRQSGYIGGSTIQSCRSATPPHSCCLKLSGCPDMARRDMRVLITGPRGQVGGAMASLAGKATLAPPPRAELDLWQGGSIPPTLDRIAPDLIINPSGRGCDPRGQRAASDYPHFLGLRGQGHQFTAHYCAPRRGAPGAAYCRRPDRGADLGPSHCRRHRDDRDRTHLGPAEAVRGGQWTRAARGSRRDQLAWLCHRDRRGPGGARRAAQSAVDRAHPHRGLPDKGQAAPQLTA
jgi:hypothetical protein